MIICVFLRIIVLLYKDNIKREKNKGQKNCFYVLFVLFYIYYVLKLINLLF